MSYGPYSLRSVRPLVMRETWPRRFISALTLALVLMGHTIDVSNDDTPMRRVCAYIFRHTHDDPRPRPRPRPRVSALAAPAAAGCRRQGSADAKGAPTRRERRRERRRGRQVVAAEPSVEDTVRRGDVGWERGT